MMHINEHIVQAYGVLDGDPICRDLVDSLSELKGEDILDLVSLANKVRARFASGTHACTIMNAQSGRCSENCRFCAQSSHHHAEIDVYPLVSKERIVEQATKTHESGVGSFGIVASGYGFKTIDHDFQQILDSIDSIHALFPDLRVCASLRR